MPGAVIGNLARQFTADGAAGAGDKDAAAPCFDEADSNFVYRGAEETEETEETEGAEGEKRGKREEK